MNWLSVFLDDAVRRQLCCRIGCTTCGAMEFRRGVIRAANAATGAPDGWPMPRATAATIATTLGQIEPGDRPPSFDLEYAVRMLISDLDWIIGRNALRTALGISWASQVLAKMERHHAEREAAWRAHEERNDPARLEENREAKRRARAEKHAARLAAKVERDRAWRELHGINSDGRHH